MTIIGCECVLPRPNVLQHTPPEIVKTMFHEAAQGKNYMNALDFATFLEKVQGQKGLDEHQVASLVTQTVLSAIAGFHFSISVQSVQLDLLGFSNYLVNAKLNPPISDTDIPTHDMTRPLSHYYIYASHNSYLTGNQLTSSSSIVPIIEALRNGCRVIELDCWEKQGQQCWSGSTNNDIVVLHGNTLTSAIPFKDCVIAIKENAFIASQYPVIITIENHMGAEMQKKAALVLREILGESLFYPSREQRPPLQFESPEVLKGFIIVSDQPPSDTIEDQLAVDPNAAQVLATDELDDAHASTSDHTRHAQRLKKHIKRAHKKAVLRVANTAAKVLRKSLLVEKIEVPETVEFQELIYLYCAKPSEMKKAKHEEGPLGRYSKMNLGRVYPFGLRFNSSNADPMLAWSHGFQIAALNLQGRDRPVWLAKGFFQVNGHTGYVKKPDIFLPGFSLSHEDILNLPIKMILRVTVLLGTNWHRNFDFFKNPDFYVKACLPVRELRYGIRSVALRSKSGASRSSKLLCHFQSFAVSSLAPPSELPHPHPGPPSSQPPPPPPSLVFEELQSPPPLSFPAPEEPQSPPPLPPPVAPEEPQPPPPSLPPAPEESQSSSPPPPRPAPEEPQPMPRPSPLA
uniref:Phosphoinositide phospholipase C n=1 Tax=Physcomitrium patens TaxID=3218 RepID=A0A2K1KBC3_PHYPA|nr:hypothetical protein PHYPA_010258 [Physcomitrium patens]